MSAARFLLPDVGEGLTEAEVVSWRVAVGDTVEINDVLVEIETAKSLVELPSPYAGRVSELCAAEGETVPVGEPLVTFAPSDDGQVHVPGQDATARESPGEPAREPVLVGYGPRESTGAPVRRRRANTTPSPVLSSPVLSDGMAPEQGGPGVRTKPPVRKLAKELGVPLAQLAPEGPITREQVLAHARRTEPPAVSPTGVPTPRPDPEQPTDGQTRIPVRGIRKATAAAMVHSAFTAPQVTEFLTVDVSRSVKLVEQLRQHPLMAGSKLTVLLLAARALLAAVREFPEINASWDGENQEIVRYHRVNLGIAAATPRGLLVPNIKDAGALTLPALAAALTNLVTTARDGRTTPADTGRGTITITNIGVFGVDTGTPILNPGEAAILCLGAVRRRPWEHRGRVALRWTTQLALSFDHRLVDGELGSRVLARVGAILENPKRELLLA